MRINNFREDLLFLKQHIEVIELVLPTDEDARIVVIPDYQGRVMTSSSSGYDGKSYGWINYSLIEKKTWVPHMNAFGGEERLWLTPEGGQFSVYFKQGDLFEYESWQTPVAIDSLPFEVTYQDSTQVFLESDASLENYLGTTFDLKIKREVSILSETQIKDILGLADLEGCKSVAYETKNSIVNLGADWQRETGMLGIWLLGMFIPSDQTNILIPVHPNSKGKLEVTDDYFGKVPEDRLQINPDQIKFVADGKCRSKIGVAAGSVKNVAGSYDATNQVLTIIRFDVDPSADYLKSTWQLHDNPFEGDVLNAYNDGPLEDGSQMGPFYELESNSSVKALKQGESLTHSQSTFHFEGDKASLSKICQIVLGVDL